MTLYSICKASFAKFHFVHDIKLARSEGASDVKPKAVRFGISFTAMRLASGVVTAIATP